VDTARQRNERRASFRYTLSQHQSFVRHGFDQHHMQSRATHFQRTRSTKTLIEVNFSVSGHITRMTLHGTACEREWIHAHRGR
jgi:hypothetical protein